MRKYAIIVIVFLIFFLIIIGLALSKVDKLNKYSNNSYYEYYINSDSNFVNKSEEDEITEDINYTTIIDHTTKFNNKSIKNKNDAIKLIEDESLTQESKCKNNLMQIENNLKESTGIYGVNYCEISKEQAKRISDTIKLVYERYPIIKEYVTNVTIVNDGGVDSYIAAFKPAYTFATSNTNDKFPFVIKIQVFLNASYYLNDNYFNNVIDNAIKTNYFPEGTNQESLIVHEFGHVLTYVLAIKYYNSINTLVVSKDNFRQYSETLNNYTNESFANQIVDEAYNNYILNNEKISKKLFRKNISMYADNSNGNGEVLYNETVAEAFHDYYLHGNSCKPESLEIVNVLNEYIMKYS